MSELVKDNAVVCYKAFTQLFKSPRTVFLLECTVYTVGKVETQLATRTPQLKIHPFVFSKIVCDTVVVM